MKFEICKDKELKNLWLRYSGVAKYHAGIPKIIFTLNKW